VPLQRKRPQRNHSTLSRRSERTTRSRQSARKTANFSNPTEESLDRAKTGEEATFRGRNRHNGERGGSPPLIIWEIHRESRLNRIGETSKVLTSLPQNSKVGGSRIKKTGGVGEGKVHERIRMRSGHLAETWVNHKKNGTERRPAQTKTKRQGDFSGCQESGGKGRNED